MYSSLNRNTLKYVKLLFSSTSSKSVGLLSNYQFSLSKDNTNNAIEAFSLVLNELPDIKGIIIGHSPQKNILFIFNENKQILVNVDNLISIGQNQKDVIRQYNFDGSIIYKEAKIMHITDLIAEEISIEISLYKTFTDENHIINKSITLSQIML